MKLPEFGPRLVANAARRVMAVWESLARDALAAFDETRAALAQGREVSRDEALRATLTRIEALAKTSALDGRPDWTAGSRASFALAAAKLRAALAEPTEPGLDVEHQRVVEAARNLQCDWCHLRDRSTYPSGFGELDAALIALAARLRAESEDAL